MSIYNAIANAGSQAGAGIEAYARNKFAVDQQRKAEEMYQQENALARQDRQQELQMQLWRDGLSMGEAGLGYIEQGIRTYGLPQMDDRARAMFIEQARSLPQAQAPVPTYREFKEGDKIVTYMIDPMTGQRERVSEAPRYNPNPQPATSVTIQMPGEKSPLTSSNTSRVQTSVMDAQKTLRDLSSIKDAYSDDFLTLWGQSKAVIGSWLDRLGQEGESVDFNAERGKFRSNVMQFFNQYRKEITGAAASEKELEQLLKSLFSDNLGPAEFKSRFNEFVTKAEANLAANKQTLTEGVDVSGVRSMDSEAINWSDLPDGR